MKKVFALVGAGLVAVAAALIPASTVLTTGCKTETIGTNTVTHLDPAAVNIIAIAGKNGAFWGAHASIQQHPNNKEWFVAAAPIVRAVATGDTDPKALATALGAIKVSGVDGAAAQLLASDLADIYSTAYSALGANAYVKADIGKIATSIADGLDMAVQPASQTKAKLYRP